MATAKINRVELLTAVTLVKPALAVKDHIPAYTHIAFDGHSALAYNDVMAISVACEFPVKCCVPGDLLLKTLSSISHEQIEVQANNRGDAITIVAGTAKVRLPVMPLTAFPFRCPDHSHSDDEVHQLDKQVLQAIKVCCQFLGTHNADHPETTGVTLYSEKRGDSFAVSTDNRTISQYHLTESNLRIDHPIILPEGFCSQVLALVKAFPESGDDVWLSISSDGLDVSIGPADKNLANVFTRVVVNNHPLDFDSIITKNLPDSIQIVDVPAAFNQALTRHINILSSEKNKAMLVHTFVDHLTLNSASKSAESADTIEMDLSNTDDLKFRVDPTLIVRALKVCDMISFNKQAVALRGEGSDFLHLIAHMH